MPVAKQQPELLLRRLEWTVIRRLDGLLQGDYRTLFRGFGLDLATLADGKHLLMSTAAFRNEPYSGSGFC